MIMYKFVAKKTGKAFHPYSCCFYIQHIKVERWLFIYTTDNSLVPNIVFAQHSSLSRERAFWLDRCGGEWETGYFFCRPTESKRPSGHSTTVASCVTCVTSTRCRLLHSNSRIYCIPFIARSSLTTTTAVAAHTHTRIPHFTCTTIHKARPKSDRGKNAIRVVYESSLLLLHWIHTKSATHWERKKYARQHVRIQKKTHRHIQRLIAADLLVAHRRHVKYYRWRQKIIFISLCNPHSGNWMRDVPMNLWHDKRVNGRMA